MENTTGISEQARTIIRVQTIVVCTSVALFALKVWAYFMTHSVAVLTDALESTVNVVTGFTGLYALRVAARPRDHNHPYGHGKAELVSASLEGLLIVVAGLLIVKESWDNLWEPHPVRNLDAGMVVVAATALANFLLGRWCIQVGTRHHSLALHASGKHLQSDTWTTIGIVCGLLLMRLTHITWIDSVVAAIFALWIIYEGISILRSTISGIMDEADQQLVEHIIGRLEQGRRPSWIDLHNLRTLKFGHTLHVDCHLTVPWYFDVREAHAEVEGLEKIMKDASPDHFLETFVHMDACQPPRSCRICTMPNCTARTQPFAERVAWTLENVTQNARHH